MSIPRDCVSLEDFERAERGLSPRPRVVVERVDPIPPVVANHVPFEKIPHGAISDLDVRLVRPSPKNAEGIIFVGYNFHIRFEDGQTVQGFFWEHDVEKLKAMIRQQQKLHLLDKIVF